MSGLRVGLAVFGSAAVAGSMLGGLIAPARVKRRRLRAGLFVQQTRLTGHYVMTNDDLSNRISLLEAEMLAALSVPLFDPAAVPSPRPCTLAFAAARRRRQGRPSRKPRHNVRLREAAPWTVASTAAGLHGSGRRRSDDRAPRSWSPQCSLRQANYVHTDASFPVPVPDFSTMCGNGNGNAHQTP